MILFLKPIFLEKIWGGSLINEFGFLNAPKKTGEVLIISALEKKSNVILNIKNKTTLHSFYLNNKKLFFNKEYEAFPLLIKIIGATDNLSIQTHPNNIYAKVHENSNFGKQESWYVLDCKNNDIIYGHKCKNKEEFIKNIKKDDWNAILNKVNISKDMVLDVPPGTVHSICTNTLVYEVQQSSDITYRLYDYGRLQNGKKRQLDIVKSLDTIYYPQAFKSPNIIKIKKDNTEQVILKNNYYILSKCIIKNSFVLDTSITSAFVTVISGNAKIGKNNISKNNSFIILLNMKVKISGNCVLLIARAR